MTTNDHPTPPPAPGSLDLDWQIYRYHWESSEGFMVADIEYDPDSEHWVYECELTLVDGYYTGFHKDLDDCKRKVKAWIAKNK